MKTMKQIGSTAPGAVAGLGATAANHLWIALLIAALHVVVAVARHGPMVIARWSDAIRYARDASPERALGPALTPQPSLDRQAPNEIGTQPPEEPSQSRP
jgi:hypothetical protein